MGTENPAHYKSHPSGIECIQVIYPLPYGAGNAIKYLWRLGMKDEDLQELTKAMWYVVHSMEAGVVRPELPFDSAIALDWWHRHENAGYRREAIVDIYNGRYFLALDTIKHWYAEIGGMDVKDVPIPQVPNIKNSGGME